MFDGKFFRYCSTKGYKYTVTNKVFKAGTKYSIADGKYSFILVFGAHKIVSVEYSLGYIRQ